jgi:hypothetical protein
MSIQHLLASRVMQFVVLLFLLGATDAHTQVYSCGDPSSGHCYGVNQWTQATEYFGAYADITQVNMSCPSGCGGVVDDEIWLADDSSSGCTSNQFGSCWVEAGTIETGSSPTYFWADARPGTGNTLNVRYLGSTDPVGTVDHYMIVKDGRTTPNNYLVFIYNDSQSTLYGGTSSVAGTGGCGSPLPQMVAKRIVIGQELAGTPPAVSNAAAADKADFTRNIWAIQALDSSYTFSYNAQSASGAVISNNPPTASWAQNPGAPSAPEGGDFTTSTAVGGYRPPPGLCEPPKHCCEMVNGKCAPGQCLSQAQSCR